MAGLFNTFTIAKRGLNVQQSHINTSSHNIANVTTEGYSRQRSVAETTRPYGGLSRFDSNRIGQVGTGAEITQIERIRDSFIDYQYREANSKAESLAAQSEFFSGIEGILGEPSSTSMQNLFSEFYASFQELSKNPEEGSSARTTVARKAQQLAQSLNQAYASIEKNMQLTQEEMQSDVVEINNYLDQIKELNKTISDVTALGQTPNDYMDKRDLLLDKLSAKLGIRVDADKLNTINVIASDFQSKDNPINNLITSDPVATNYVRFSFVQSADAKGNQVTLQYQPNGSGSSKTIVIDAASEEEAQKIAASLNENRILIGDSDGIVGDGGDTMTPKDITKAIFITNTISTDSDGNPINSVTPNDKDSLVGNNSKGEIAGKQQSQVIAKAYLEKLDKIAATVAYSVNAIQTGSMTNDTAAPDGRTYDLIFVNSSNNDGTKSDSGITAKNITINLDIIDSPNKINASSTHNSGDKNNDRALAMADLLNIKFDTTNITNVGSMTREQFLRDTGNTFANDATKVGLTSNTSGLTAANAYKNMVTDLGTNSATLQSRVDAADKQVAGQADNRASVSGVSLDEEMTDLIQFQHAYSANAKIISTVDELLDVVINGLKR